MTEVIDFEARQLIFQKQTLTNQMNIYNLLSSLIEDDELKRLSLKAAEETKAIIKIIDKEIEEYGNDSKGSEAGSGEQS